MTKLFPAAQAVLDAFNREARPEPHHQREAIAAALRAAADQVVPEKLESYGIRYELLRIAEELDGINSLEPNDLSHLSEEEFQSLAPQGYHAP